jgi:hypothetical protein
MPMASSVLAGYWSVRAASSGRETGRHLEVLDRGVIEGPGHLLHHRTDDGAVDPGGRVSRLAATPVFHQRGIAPRHGTGRGGGLQIVVQGVRKRRHSCPPIQRDLSSMAGTGLIPTTGVACRRPNQWKTRPSQRQQRQHARRPVLQPDGSDDQAEQKGAETSSGEEAAD